MGIKDVCYVSLFDKKDLPSLYGLAERIRTTHDQTLVNDFNLKCQKKVDDHNSILEVGNKKIEFLQASKTDDLIVTTGINQCLDQILGVSVVRWQYMARGTQTFPPLITDTTLSVETSPRVDMSTKGWREFASSTLRFAAIFGESVPTTTVQECGVFTALTAGIMLNRNTFTGSAALVHTLDQTGFVLSSIIDFVPVL